MDCLYLNPYVSVLEIDNKIYIKSFKEYSFTIQKKTAFQYLLSKSEFTIDELLNYFSYEEINILKETRLVFTDKNLIPTTTDMLSRQRGLFSIISPNYKLFENQISSIRVLILGAGAIGTHVLWGLITMGIENITIIDFDVVEESNLNRQLFYGFDDIGYKKVKVLKKKINASYPNINFTILDERIESEEYLLRVLKHDFVFKAFDTPKEGTEWVNTVCVKKKVPYISGGFLNETGLVGPIYVPGITSCYSCNKQREGERYSSYSPTFSPIVTNVVSKMMLVFLDIVIKNYDNLSQYYVFNLYTSKWKEINYETKVRCSVCGNVSHYDTIRLKTIVEYLLVAFVSCGVSWFSNQLHNYIYNYLLIFAFVLVFYKRIKQPGFILNCSIIYVTVNIINYMLWGNVTLFANDIGVLPYIQGIALTIVIICIMITLVFFIWYILGTIINKSQEVLKNAYCSRYNKKI